MLSALLLFCVGLFILNHLLKLLVSLINVGGQAASILSWLGIPSPLQRSQPSTEQLELTRQKLLKIVKKEVHRRLTTSLHNLVKLDLHMEDQRQRVGSPKIERVPEDNPQKKESGFWTSINRFLRLKGNDQQSSSLKSTQKIIEVFERPEVSGRLLILGEPGSGKTTELLQLAQDLITRVEEKSGQPVPVILELSSWDGESIDKWVTSQLKKLYSLSESTTQQWLVGNHILLMLDGLDELGLTKQKQCIEKINQFLETTRTSELVVCCRREEYEAGQIDLSGLNGAVYLEALREDQIRQYFEELNRLSLWDNVRGNPALLELAQKPLFLFILIVAYQGNPIRNEQELFDTYIEKQLHEPKNQGTYKPDKEPTLQQTRHYLVWLAQQLEAISETEFLIEGLQPTWLLYKHQKMFYRVALGLLFGLPSGLGTIAINRFYALKLTPLLIYGLVSGVLVGMIASADTVIEPVEEFQIPERNELISSLGLSLRLTMPIAGILGLITCFTRSLVTGLWIGLFSSLILILFFSLFGTLTFGLRNTQIQNKDFPNQGIKLSAINALFYGCFFGLCSSLVLILFFMLISFIFVVDLTLELDNWFVIISGFGWLVGSFYGFLSFGLYQCLKHLIVRIALTFGRHTPWNYARFLEHAVKHRFIQRTGGRYRFVHDLLRKHFAAMPLE